MEDLEKNGTPVEAEVVDMGEADSSTDAVPNMNPDIMSGFAGMGGFANLFGGSGETKAALETMSTLLEGYGHNMDFLKGEQDDFKLEIEMLQQQISRNHLLSLIGVGLSIFAIILAVLGLR